MGDIRKEAHVGGALIVHTHIVQRVYLRGTPGNVPNVPNVPRGDLQITPLALARSSA